MVFLSIPELQGAAGPTAQVSVHCTDLMKVCMVSAVAGSISDVKCRKAVTGKGRAGYLTFK